MEHSRLAQKILSLKAIDLSLRELLIKRGELGNGYSPEMERLHINNAEILSKIIDQIGYPTTDKVGKEAAEAAWLIIQHAISSPDFMRKCLKLLELAVSNEKANPMHLAYLSDRIAVFEGRPQRYGTQFDWDEDGLMSPNKIDDLDTVNQRRASLGLNTLQEQTLLMRVRVEEENETPPTNLSRRQEEMKEWKARVGW